jgi:hypothetical protein
MKKQSKERPPQRVKKNEKTNLTYPPFGDIYMQSEEVHEVDPNDISKLKFPNQKPAAKNEKDFVD